VVTITIEVATKMTAIAEVTQNRQVEVATITTKTSKVEVGTITTTEVAVVITDRATTTILGYVKGVKVKDIVVVMEGDIVVAMAG
jgi:hypothetical protein